MRRSNASSLATPGGAPKLSALDRHIEARCPCVVGEAGVRIVPVGGRIPSNAPGTRISAGQLIAAGTYRIELIVAGPHPANREMSCSKHAGTLP